MKKAFINFVEKLTRPTLWQSFDPVTQLEFNSMGMRYSYFFFAPLGRGSFYSFIRRKGFRLIIHRDTRSDAGTGGSLFFY